MACLTILGRAPNETTDGVQGDLLEVDQFLHPPRTDSHSFSAGIVAHPEKPRTHAGAVGPDT